MRWWRRWRQLDTRAPAGTHAHSQSDSFTEPDAVSDAQPHAISDTYAVSDAEPHADANPDTDSLTHAPAHTRGQP